MVLVGYPAFGWCFTSETARDGTIPLGNILSRCGFNLPPEFDERVRPKLEVDGVGELPERGFRSSEPFFFSGQTLRRAQWYVRDLRGGKKKSEGMG